MKAFKGFNKNMTCRNFQYEEGKTYKTDEAKWYGLRDGELVVVGEEDEP